MVGGLFHINKSNIMYKFHPDSVKFIEKQKSVNLFNNKIMMDINSESNGIPSTAYLQFSD